MSQNVFGEFQFILPKLNIQKYLQVENILVVGHSCCGGIRALMSMPDEEDSRFDSHNFIHFSIQYGGQFLVCTYFLCEGSGNCTYFLFILYIFSRSFIRSWVVTGKSAKLSTKASASNLSFDLQCKHCEKVQCPFVLLTYCYYVWQASLVSVISLREEERVLFYI